MPVMAPEMKESFTPTASWIIGEVTDWKGHSPERLKAMKNHSANLERLRVEAIED